MNLYAVTIYGHKFYFTGELTAEATEAAEHFCAQLECNANDSDPRKLLMLLLRHIESGLASPVVPVGVKHIFRINF